MKVLLCPRLRPQDHIWCTQNQVVVRRKRIQLKEMIPTGKVVRLQVKQKEVSKVPVIQESIYRPSVVKVPLLKSQNESIKESDTLEGKIPRFVPKVEQKEEKNSESEDVIGKSEAQNPRVGHNNATPNSLSPPSP